MGPEYYVMCFGHMLFQIDSLLMGDPTLDSVEWNENFEN